MISVCPDGFSSFWLLAFLYDMWLFVTCFTTFVSVVDTSFMLLDVFWELITCVVVVVPTLNFAAYDTFVSPVCTWLLPFSYHICEAEEENHDYCEEDELTEVSHIHSTSCFFNLQRSKEKHTNVLNHRLKNVMAQVGLEPTNFRLLFFCSTDCARGAD